MTNDESRGEYGFIRVGYNGSHVSVWLQPDTYHEGKMENGSTSSKELAPEIYCI